MMKAVEQANNDNSLKAATVSRLLYDMVHDIKDSIGQNNLLMMIVDPYTMKVMSTFLTISELFARGIVSIENLHLVRKKFPRYHCIYFINPTQEAIDYVKKDFPDPDHPQYSRMHLFFSHRITDQLLDDLISSSHLAKRIKTCKEINISYFIRGKNMFDLNMPNAIEIFTQVNEKNKDVSPMVDKMLTSIAERLFCTLATLKEFPYVQFQKNNPITTRLAKILTGMLKEFYSSKVFNEKRGILLLADRSLDATTPLLHDYSYKTILYDYYDLNENDQLTFNEKKGKLDDKDEVWTKFKNRHIAEVLNGLQQDFREFMESDLSRKQRDKDNLESFEKMADLMHGMKEFKEKSRQYGLHLTVAGDISNKYGERNIYDMIDLEQEIVTGTNSAGEEVKNKEILGKFAKMMTRITDEEKVRLMLTLHTCLDITEKDFNIISDKIDAEKKRAIYNLEWLGITFSNRSKGGGRRVPSVKKQEDQEFGQKTKLKFKTLRSTPILEGVVEQCSNVELSPGEYTFTEEPSNLKKPKKKLALKTGMFGGDDDSDDTEPNLIVFMLGGLAHNEICALERLREDKRINHNLVIGTTSIYTADSYVKVLQSLPKPTEVASGAKVELKSIELQSK